MPSRCCSPRIAGIDLLFALDSIPAVYGVTEHPLIVLAVVLGFIGVKLILHFAHVEIATDASLAVIAAVLATTTLTSLRATRGQGRRYTPDPIQTGPLRSDPDRMPTITTTQITTRVRTYALIAGLTALTISVGAVIGGAALPLFIALAVAFNAAGYFLSDRIALKLARARRLSPADAPELHAMTAALAGRAQIPVPRLYVMPGEAPNAFATGRDPGHAAVVVTHGLLSTMDPEHVRAILAHELGHIRNHDILVSSLAATLAGAIAAAVNLLQLSFLFGGAGEDAEESPLGLVGALAAMILAPVAGTLLQLGISRQREYLADATAARLLGSGAPLAEALATIDEAAHGIALDVHPATAPMYSVSPLRRGTNLAQLFSTHPPIRERIRRLHALDARPAPPRPLVAHA